MGSLEFLYNTAFGRLLLKPLASSPVSRLSGWFLDRRISAKLIPSFVKKNNINVEDYDITSVRTFNDFFCRRIKEGRRPIETDPGVLMSPCDGLLTVYPISKSTVLPVKQSSYTIDSLLDDEDLASKFEGGYCLVFRLCVDHYHRYAWFDGGRKKADRRIKGVYHTVRPVALAARPVFIQNTREYSVIESDGFGTAVQMEVGAMLVGRIVNDMPGEGAVARGQEKGHFEYGGSTIIVLIGKGAADIREDILKASSEGAETPVKMGEGIGKGK